MLNKKEFEEYLNKKYENVPLWRNHEYGPRKRGYGSYLRTQDKIRFEEYFNEYKKEYEEKVQHERNEWNVDNALCWQYIKKHR